MATSPTLLSDTQDWREELAHLLELPIQSDEEVHREGDLIGLRVTPLRSSGQTTVDLLVTLFFLALSPTSSQEAEAHNIARGDYLADLQDADYHVRMAACRALGQLSDASATNALQHAERDENRHVRAAATHALALLEKPRFAKEELSGVQLSLWQQVRHLWKPLLVAQTNHRGQAQFPRLPASGSYRLQVRVHAQRGRTTLSAQTAPTYEEERLAAAENEEQASPLPPPQQLVLEGGSLFCSFSHDEEEQLIVEFRSDAAQLRESWVHFRVLQQESQEEVVNALVELETNPRGILVGRLPLGESIDPTQNYEILFEPLAMSPEEG